MRAVRALSVLSAVPLVLVGGVAVLGSSGVPAQIGRPSVTAAPTAASRYCAGPLQLPDELLERTGDTELAVTPPSPAIAVRTAALEPSSSLLFGEVAASGTEYDAESGGVRAPSVSTTAMSGGNVEAQTESTELGVTTQTIPAAEEPVAVQIDESSGAVPVSDIVQHTLTASGDFRSLAASRCTAPTSDAVFLGASTQTGDSAALTLRNPSEQPATAAVQVWTEDGPAQMKGRSQVVVAPGAEERILLESVAPNAERVGVRVVTIGAPLVMSLQATERDGITPGGAEVQSPLPAPATTQRILGAHVLDDGSASLDVLNMQGEDATANVRIISPQGPVSAPSLEGVTLPGGSVTSLTLPPLDPNNYTIEIDSDLPISGVVRSTVTGGEAAGTTAQAPREFALAAPAQPLSGGSVQALPVLGPSGRLLLQATGNSDATVVPIGADGGAGTPITVDLSPDRLTVIDGSKLTGTDGPAAAVAITPTIPGDVHASWVQREKAPAGGPMISILPVESPAAAEKPLSVSLG